MLTESPSAIIFDIHRGSFNDGPGIRTTIFVKGCPLRCAWCHNPEAMKRAPQTVTTSTGETKTYGMTMTAKEALAEVIKDKVFFLNSQGGVTISGGEPMMSYDFTYELARLVKEQDIHICLDSTGYGSGDQWRKILPYIDTILFDYKATGDANHKKWTGTEQTPLLNTLDTIEEFGKDVILRCPIIPTVNDNHEHLSAISTMQKRYRFIRGAELMPYHETGRYKWDQLDQPYQLTHVNTPTEATINNWKHQAGIYNAS